MRPKDTPLRRFGFAADPGRQIFNPRMLLALALLSVIHDSTAVVDCRVACRRCREKTDVVDIVEVYCAMCTECKERRIERMQAAATTDCYPVQESVDCPELSCEDSDQTQKVPLKKIVTSTTAVTTTTPRRVCSPPPCKPPPCYCMPFMPTAMCPCPAQSEPTTETIRQKLVLPKRKNDYTYVFVGVPKDLLNE